MVQQYNPSRPNAVAAVYNSYYGGKNFNFAVTQGQIERIPVWPVAEPNPPLPVRQAVALARLTLGSLVGEPERWRLGEAALVPFGDHERWIYLIEFRGFLPPNIMDGAPPLMRIVVLMSGEVIQPVVAERPLP